MSVTYHINPDTHKVGLCRAKKKCDFTVDGIIPKHYATLEEAQKAAEHQLENNNGTFASIKNKNAVNKQQRRPEDEIAWTPIALKEKQDFIDNFETKTYDEILDFMNNSPENHEFVNTVINDRASYAVERYGLIKRAEARKLDKSVIALARRDYDDYRNRTAELVEAYTDSNYYTSLAKVSDRETIGDGIVAASHPTHSRGWYEARYDTVGGSDVGVLASLEFDGDDAPGYVKANMSKIVKSKITPLTNEDFTKQLSQSHTSRVGALYRGTVWESRIRDQYIEDHPGIVVEDVQGTIQHRDRSWQSVNIDGLLVDERSGDPVGILEIKTGGSDEAWKNGVPTSYRAQTLYYLNTTGLEYADVRACINDGQVFEYRLYKEDDVVEGAGVKMEDYLNNTVSPWFDDLKSKRPDYTLV